VEKGPPEKASIQVAILRCDSESGGIPVLIPPMSDEDLEQVLLKISV